MNNPVVKVYKTSENSTLPEYKTKGAACFDIAVVESVILKPGEKKLVGTGLIFEVPENYKMQIVPRSGISAKTNIYISNSPGTVDSDYRGEVKLILHNVGDTEEFVEAGSRMAQGEIIPIVQAQLIEVNNIEELSKTERNNGGFGSTGKY